MSTTLKKQDTALKQPTRKVAPPPKKSRRKLINWIEYSAVIIVVGAAAIIGVVMLRSGSDEALPFDVEAGSGLIIGQRHIDPGFSVEPRFVGESDMTLAEFEATFDGFGTLYEAESGLSIGPRHETGFSVDQRIVGESDMTLEEFQATR